MKKVLFLLLFLVVLGAANVSAQVRIGGDGEPNEAAVLDLNEDGTTTGTKGLALPRVSLNSNDTLLGYSGLLEGMLVYNTNADMTDGDGVGVYYWDGNEWVKPAGGSVYEGSTSIKLSGNSFQRAALSGDVTAAENSNVTTIADNAVTSAKIANGAVSLAKIDISTQTQSVTITGTTAGAYVLLPAPAGCSYYNTIMNWNRPDLLTCGWNNAANMMCARTAASSTNFYLWTTCLK